MSKLNALLVQAQLGWEGPAQNRDHLQALISGADGQFDLVVLPETFTTGFLGDANLPTEGMDGETVQWMKDLAAQYDSAIAGSVVIAEGEHRFNRFLFVTPDAAVRHYDKRHLFTYGGENRRYTAGNERVTVNYKGWRINLQVCYDLRFPAWCRNRNDYDLMLLVANWPARRVRHWSLLLEARAVENQSWVIGVNRVGEDEKGLVYPGCSVVHDPTGACTADLADTEGCKIVEMDLSLVEKIRSDFPFQPDADEFVITGPD